MSEEESEYENNANEDERTGLRININELEEWFFEMIFNKYNRDLNSVFVHWKPILKTLSSIEQNSLEIGVHLTHTNEDYKIYCHIINIKNIIYCLNELIDELPLCIDYDLLINFIYTLGKVLENIRTLLHPLTHLQDKEGKVGKRLKKIYKGVEVIPILSKRLFNTIQLFSLPLKKISFLKRIFKSEIIKLEEKYKELEGSEDRSIAYQSLSLKLSQLMDHFNNIKNDEILVRERELSDEIDRLLAEIRSSINPFHRIFNQLIEKKKKDQKIFSVEDKVKLKEISFEFPIPINPYDQSALLQFSNHCTSLLSLSTSYTHIISNKNQNLLVELKNTFNASELLAKLTTWANLSELLHSHVTSPEYSSKLKLFNSTKGELSNLSKKYEKIQQEVKKDLDQYQLYLNQFRILQLNLSKLIYKEFQVRVDITL